MREKKWTDCPACGARGSMRQRAGQSERIQPAGYPPLDISELDGQFCSACGDGFWSMRSERRITRLLAAHKAEFDAGRVVAAELASVREGAEALGVTVQAIHRMMDEGRLRYVLAGGTRLPIRKDLEAKARARGGTPV